MQDYRNMLTVLENKNNALDPDIITKITEYIHGTLKNSDNVNGIVSKLNFDMFNDYKKVVKSYMENTLTINNLLDTYNGVDFDKKTIYGNPLMDINIKVFFDFFTNNGTVFGKI